MEYIQSSSHEERRYAPTLKRKMWLSVTATIITTALELGNAGAKEITGFIGNSLPFLIGSIAVLYGGSFFFQKSYEEFRQKKIGQTVFFSLALIILYIVSLIRLYQGDESILFGKISLLIVIALLNEWLKSYAVLPERSTEKNRPQKNIPTFSLSRIAEITPLYIKILILLLGGISTIIWLLVGSNIVIAFERFATILLVAIPGTFLTVLSIRFSAKHFAKEKGIIFEHPYTLEELKNIHVVVFTKEELLVPEASPQEKHLPLLRPEAEDTVKMLKKENIETVMITRDREEAAREVAKILNIREYFSGVSIEEKREKIKYMQHHGKKIAFVYNTPEDKKIAEKANTTIILPFPESNETKADLRLLKHNLKLIPYAINISNITVRKMGENYFLLLFYHLFATSWAIGLFIPLGLPPMNPLIALAHASVWSALLIKNAQSIEKKLENFQYQEIKATTSILHETL